MQAEFVPRLETPRLILRGWRADDAEAHAAMTAEPEVMRHLGGVLSAAQSWRALAQNAGHWVLRGYGQWAIERRADGVLLGRAGLWNPDGWPGLELGWVLARHAWGHGYATEAARAAMEWTWASVETERLISLIAPANGPSIRVAERLGLELEREQTLDGNTTLIYGIDRPGGPGLRTGIRG
jgi:RimJ/RimL family protein N-acetyltransferase